MLKMTLVFNFFAFPPKFGTKTGKYYDIRTLQIIAHRSTIYVLGVLPKTWLLQQVS